jgi:hypothetical protein
MMALLRRSSPFRAKTMTPLTLSDACCLQDVKGSPPPPPPTHPPPQLCGLSDLEDHGGDGLSHQGHNGKGLQEGLEQERGCCTFPNLFKLLTDLFNFVRKHCKFGGFSVDDSSRRTMYSSWRNFQKEIKNCFYRISLIAS